MEVHARAEAILGEGSRLVCALTFKLARSAVVASDGHTYDREALAGMFESQVRALSFRT